MERWVSWHRSSCQEKGGGGGGSETGFLWSWIRSGGSFTSLCCIHQRWWRRTGSEPMDHGGVWCPVKVPVLPAEPCGSGCSGLKLKFVSVALKRFPSWAGGRPGPNRGEPRGPWWKSGPHGDSWASTSVWLLQVSSDVRGHMMSLSAARRPFDPKVNRFCRKPRSYY